jgi:hypothetical protein
MKLRSVLLALAVSAAAWAADLTGTWDAAVESSLGSGSPTFVLKQEGDKVSGDYSGALGTAKLKGTVKGDDVEFTFKVDAGGESIDVLYKGKLSDGGKKLAGKVAFGTMGEGNFTATRR